MYFKTLEKIVRHSRVVFLTQNSNQFTLFIDMSKFKSSSQHFFFAIIGRKQNSNLVFCIKSTLQLNTNEIQLFRAKTISAMSLFSHFCILPRLKY